MEGRHPLVALNDHGDRSPLFCMHPVGGHVNAYLCLPELLGREQPIYALRSRAQVTPESEHATLLAMAMDYATVIQRARPHGPVRLFGWSMGALTAHAVGCELERRGTGVELVAMVDPQIGPSQPMENDLPVAVSMAIQIFHPSPPRGSMIRSELRLLHLRDADTSIARWCAARGLLPDGDVPEDEFEAAIKLFTIHRGLVSRHEPAVCCAPMLVWKARAIGSSSDREWSQHTTASCSIDALGGDHFSIMRPPHIEAISADLRAFG